MTEPKFEARNSSISGKGLFATTTIKEGEVVVNWHPKVLSREQANALPASEQHYLYPDGNKMLYMQEPERFMNHSCERTLTLWAKVM